MRSTLLAAVIVSAAASPTLAELRVANYNIAVGIRPMLGTVLEQIGNEQFNGVSRPIDVLLLQEVNGPGQLNAVVSVLNGIYGANAYAAAPYTGISTGNGLPTMVYKTSTIQLNNTIAIGNIGGSSNARQTLRFQVMPIGYTAPIYLYNSHYKASNTTSDANRRNAEATSNRNDAATLGATANVMYAGDLNLYGGFEPAFQTLTAPGVGGAIDPLNIPNNWASNFFVQYAHTQSPVTGFDQYFPGQIGGGMDDRFDFQLPTAPLSDGEGLSIIDGTYRGFGNNGTHGVGSAITSASNTWNPAGLTIPAAQVLNAIARTSDHIPLVAEYQLPARMEVSAPLSPPVVIIGATNVGYPINLTNAAGVNDDELDVRVTVTGDETGTYNITDIAGGDTAYTAVATATRNTPGQFNVMLTATAISQEAAGAPVTMSSSVTVLDHARPSWDEASDALSRMIDLGIFGRGMMASTEPVLVYNRERTANFTADLSVGLDSMSGSPAFIIDVSRLISIPAGFGEFAEITFNPSMLGTQMATFVLNTSDIGLPGAISLSDLTLNVQALVALPGDANLDDVVDVTDLGILAANFRGMGGWTMGDFNRDGVIDVSDLGVLAANFRTTASEPSFETLAAAFGLPAVPEPATLSLLAIMPTMLRRRARS